MQLFRDCLNKLAAGNKNGYLLSIIVGSGLFLAVVTGILLMGGKVLNGVRVGGVEVGGLRTQVASQKLAEHFDPLLTKKVVLSYNNRSFSVVLNALGIHPDYQRSAVNAYRIGRRGDLWNRIRERFRVYRHGADLPLSFNHNEQALDSFYRILEASFAVEPVRTVVYVDAAGKVSYTQSKDGKAIDRARLTRMLEEALVRPEVNFIEIPVNVVKPWLSEADVERWGLNTVLGMYSTRFNPTLTDRVHNLKVASNAINNVILYPGQNFSFNTWVGPRLSETGYKEAPVVVEGELVPGIGGGVCQVTSTLYNAVLLANMKVVTRYNHSIPITYVPMGRDATVVYGGLDFIFENNLKTPVLLVAMVEASTLRVAVLGKKQGWKEVFLETEVLEKYPYQTKEEYDPSLGEEERVKVQDGRDGFKVALYRTVTYEGGRLDRQLVNTSVYPSRAEKYKTGKHPGKKEKSSGIR